MLGALNAFVEFFIFGGLTTRYAHKSYFPNNSEKPSTKSRTEPTSQQFESSGKDEGKEGKQTASEPNFQHSEETKIKEREIEVDAEKKRRNEQQG